MKCLLAKNGFTKIKVKVTGIHPERLIKNKKLLSNKLVFSLVTFYAKITGLGDTFEMYAKKK